MNMPYQQPMMNYTPNYGAYQYNPMANYQRYQQPEPTQLGESDYSAKSIYFLAIQNSKKS